MNCGANIVAVTAWMAAEMAKCKKLLAASKAGDGKGTNGGGLAYS